MIDRSYEYDNELKPDPRDKEPVDAQLSMEEF